MHKNTYVFIIGLAVFAALVTGVNIAHRLNSSPQQEEKVSGTPTEESIPTPIISSDAFSATLSATLSATPKQNNAVNSSGSQASYMSSVCGVAVTYPANLFTIEEVATNGAALVNRNDSNQSILIGCEQEIPRPAIAADKIEKRTVDGVAATLYHDASLKDGSSMDMLIFRHPKRGIDIIIAGFGSAYNDIIKTVKIQ